MLVGVPKEIKDNEFRVGMTPASVAELVHHGHQVIVEKGAGLGSGLSTPNTSAPARRSSRRPRNLRTRGNGREGQGAARRGAQAAARGQILFTYLHLAPDLEQTQRPDGVGRDLHRL
jgi:alanine dehydrogenase